MNIKYVMLHNVARFIWIKLRGTFHQPQNTNFIYEKLGDISGSQILLSKYLAWFGVIVTNAVRKKLYQLYAEILYSIIT